MEILPRVFEGQHVSLCENVKGNESFMYKDTVIRKIKRLIKLINTSDIGKSLSVTLYFVYFSYS